MHAGAGSPEPQYSPAVFEKVLIANRGEISIRVARALREMGIGSVAVYSEIERDAPHVREADEAFLLGPATPAESYLNVEKILEIASNSGAEAIHPGYGFLAENAPFAAACREGQAHLDRPPSEGDRGDGLQDRGAPDHGEGRRPDRPRRDRAGQGRRRRRRSRRRRSATRSPARRRAEAAARASACAQSEDELEEAFEGASREGEKFFSDPTVYLERYLEDPRHVEVQVLADAKGNVIHLGERDCSIQRRHQKLIEESPGPQVDDEMRERIGKIATDAAARGRLPLGGNRRGPAGGRRLLLPGDEHPRPGRALRHRDGHRLRHRPRAGQDRRRREALDLARRTSSCAATRSSAGSTRRPPTRTSRRRPGGSRPTGSRRAPACASTRGSRRAPR